MRSKTLAIATLAGVTIITIADAPQWRLEAYAGWLGAMAGAAFVGTVNSSVGNALAGLLIVTLLLHKGQQALGGALSFMGEKTDLVNTAVVNVYPFRTREMR